MKRHYPPAVQIHVPGCAILPAGLETLPTPQLAQRYPNGKPHHCYHFTRDAAGVAEQVFYPPHAYKPSSILPFDAVRPLCTSCRGTHEGDTDIVAIAIAGTTLQPAPGAAQSLILPGRATPGRLVLPGNARPGEAAGGHFDNQRSTRFHT